MDKYGKKYAGTEDQLFCPSSTQNRYQPNPVSILEYGHSRRYPLATSRVRPFEASE